MTVKSDGAEKEIIVDTRPPVILKPPNKGILKDMKVLPITRKYQDVNIIEMSLAERRTGDAECRGWRKNLTMLTTEREDIQPLLCMDWLRECNWAIQKIENTTNTTNQPTTRRLNSRRL